MRPPGTRDHDNDKEDFRSIVIVPTPRELQSREDAYLPSDTDTYVDHPESAHLDRLVRLMREDMLGPLREVVDQALPSRFLLMY